MKWPWVSSRAYGLLLDERDWLRSEMEVGAKRVDQLQDALVRLKRREHGLTEAPRVRKPVDDPMPIDMVEYFRSITPEALGKHQREQAEREHARGASWADLRRDLYAEGDDGE